MEVFNIEKASGYDKNTIIKNYDYTINYVFSTKPSTYKCPSLKISKDAVQHFKEVRDLYMLGIRAEGCGLIALFLIMIFVKKKHTRKSYLKYSGIILILVPIILLLLCSVNFSKAFTIFHLLLFNNDKWLFSPEEDQIINILPEEYFALCGGIILILCIVSGVVLLLSYVLKHKKTIQ